MLVMRYFQSMLSFALLSSEQMMSINRVMQVIPRAQKPIVPKVMITMN